MQNTNLIPFDILEVYANLSPAKRPQYEQDLKRILTPFDCQVIGYDVDTLIAKLQNGCK